ncbi:aldose epimerase family protein [Cupriavidus campinensis]
MVAVITERFQGQELVRVGVGGSYLLVAPAHGGRLVRWVHRGTEILYWPADADWTRVAKVRGGNPLLFPFIGRHFVDGEAGKWRDAEGVVHALPQHGFARDMAFAVSDFSESTVSMTLTSSDATCAGYPFDFVFTATYRLLPDGLEVTLKACNTGDRPLPYYAGHHFYFALPHGQRSASRLSMPVADRVRQTPDGALTGAEPGDSVYRLDDGRLQDTFHVLRGPGASRLETPRYEIGFELDAPGSVPWHAVTTWTEREDSDFYCVEPWLGLPNAIGHGRGLRWVAPGEAEVATCRLVIGKV